MPHNTPEKKRAWANRYYHSSDLRREKHQTGARFARWHRSFNVTDEDLMRMLDNQKDLCAACGEPFVDGFASLRTGVVGLVPTLDHDHSCCPGEGSCGKCIRAIVHLRCNRLMGRLQDNPQLLRKCADYLERHSKKPQA